MIKKAQPQAARIAANLSTAELAAINYTDYGLEEAPPYRTLSEVIACDEFSSRYNRKANLEQEIARKRVKAIRHPRARFKANPWLRGVLAD